MINNRELCDPFRRGKLTKQGWRVAYHIARSAKSRRLQIPTTLPACLCPPGYEPPAPAPRSGAGDKHAGGSQSNQKDPQTEKDKGSVASEEGGGKFSRNVAKRGNTNKVIGGAVAKTMEGREQHKKKKKDTKGTKGGAGTIGTDEAVEGSLGRKQRRKRDVKLDGNGTGGDTNVVAATTTTTTTTTKTTGKVIPNVTTKGLHGGGEGIWIKSTPPDRETPTKEVSVTTATVAVTTLAGKSVTFDEDSGAFAMSDEERSRYNKVFDKMTKGKSGKNIGGKQVCIAVHFVRLRIHSSRTEWECKILEPRVICCLPNYVRSPRSMPRKDNFAPHRKPTALCSSSNINRHHSMVPA